MAQIAAMRLKIFCSKTNRTSKYASAFVLQKLMTYSIIDLIS